MRRSNRLLEVVQNPASLAVKDSYGTVRQNDPRVELKRHALSERRLDGPSGGNAIVRMDPLEITFESRLEFVRGGAVNPKHFL